jgi:hypothetical protein
MQPRRFVALIAEQPLSLGLRAEHALKAAGGVGFRRPVNGSLALHAREGLKQTPAVSNVTRRTTIPTW